MGVSSAQPVAGGSVADRTVSPSKFALNFGGFLRNKIINGDFNIAQRGGTFSTPSNGAYTLDRWAVSYDGSIGTFSLSRQGFTVGQTAVPDEPEFFMEWNQTVAGSGSNFRRIVQRIENVRSLAGKTVTLSFYAKADSSRSLAISLVQNFGSGGSADVATSLGSASLGTGFQRFTSQVSVPSISGKTLGTGNYLELRFDLPINVGMTIDISHVQIEEQGDTAFEQRPISLEQSLCERYYQIAPTAINSSAVSIPFKTTMRATPTVSGGGAGFATSNLSASGGSCLQTSPASANLTLEAEL